MSEPNVYNLPAGVYVLWCGGTPVPVTEDPVHMTSERKKSICQGASHLLLQPDIKINLVQRDDGHFDARVESV